MRAEFKKRENGEQSCLTAERVAELDNLRFDWVIVIREKCQRKTKSNSSKDHQLINNNQIPVKGAMLRDRRQESECHPQYQHEPEEVSPVFPFCASADGGKRFREISEELLE